MKKITVYLAVLILTCSFLFGGTAAFAAEAGTVHLTAEQTHIRKGEKLHVILSYGGYKQGNQSVNVLKGTFNYDPAVFETPSQQNFVPLDTWENVQYNPESGKFILFTRSGHNVEENLLKITLTAKNDLTAGDTYIEVRDLKVSEGREDVFPGDTRIKLSVISENAPLRPLTQTGGITAGSSDFPSDQQQVLQENVFEEQVALQENILDEVQAGAVDSGNGINILLLIGILLLLLVILTVLVYIKKSRVLSTRFLSVAIILSASVLFAAGSVYAFSGKGDLNGDGLVDYADVDLFQKHLILLKTLENGGSSAADMNADGKLTVTDLSLLIHKIEKTLDYDVTITSAHDQFFYEKQEDILYRFNARVSHGGEIESITLNGAEYGVKKSTGDMEYIVALNAGDSAGILDLDIEKVTLKGGREVSVRHTERIEVLRSVPSLAGFIAEELPDTAQMKISFELIDEDLALSSSGLEVLKISDGEYISVDFKSITEGMNEFILDLDEDTPYAVYLFADYNRSCGEIKTEEDHSGSLALLKEIQLNIDYDFSFSRLSTETQDGISAERFSKNQPVVLSFDSSNSTKFEPESISVNGKLYSVRKSENRFYATLDGFSEAGRALITAEYLVLENGKKFILEKDHSVSVTILKQIPEITDLSVTEAAEHNYLDISFTLNDPDYALSAHKIVVENEKGDISAVYDLKTNELENNAFNKSIKLTDNALTAFYTVKIIADCDLTGDESEKEFGKILAHKTFSALPRAIVLSGVPSKDIVEKGEKTEITYEIQHNVDSDISAIVVNNIELQPEKLQGRKWKVTLQAPEQAGAGYFDLTQIVFENGIFINVLHTVQVEVMKSLPVITDYKAEDIIERDQVRFTFSLNDYDRALLSGKALLLSKEGVLAYEKEISSAGALEFTADVKEKTEYIFRVVLDIKRTEDSAVQVKDEIVFEKTVYMERDYGLQISDIKTSDSQTQTVYFEKNSSAIISFRAETVTSLSAQAVFVNGVEYPLAAPADDYYEFSFDTGAVSGVKQLAIEKIIMENGKQLSADADTTVRFEVLKSVPEVKNFSAKKELPDKLKVGFEIEDADGALIEARFQIAEKGGSILLDTPVFAGENEFSVKLSGSEEYTFEITADYDRDTNVFDGNSNDYQNVQVFSDSVTVSRDAIQFKDISQARLFRSDSGDISEIEILDITTGLPGDANNYFAVIEMEDLPDLYSSVKEFRFDSETGRLFVVLAQEDLIYYHENGSVQNEFEFRIAYRDAHGVHPVVKSAQELFAEMASDPAGSYELTEDLDAYGLSLNSPAVSGVFTGELNGNGYSILNLQTSLFQTLSGAHIKNLVLDNAEITSARSGILAGVIQNNSLVENVYITDSSVSNGVDELGAFAGNLNHSTIKESASVNVSVKGLVAVGGIVGKTSNGAVIENCYVIGRVQGTYDHPTLGARVGGIAGWHGGGKIAHCFTQAQITAPANKGNGGIIGGPNSGSPIIENSISMSKGAGYRIAGFDVLDNAKNVYEYSLSSSISNITESNKNNIKKTDKIFEKDLYKNELGFDEEKWNLELLIYGKRPGLISSPVADNHYNIPEYSLLTAEENYQPEREQAYANMAKLMPYSDVRLWIEYGNKLRDGDTFAAKSIRYVLPLDANGTLVSGLNSDDLADVKKIRLVFEKEKMQEYDVSFAKTMGNIIAVYKIAGEELIYQPLNYISKADSDLIESVLNIVKAWEYADISMLTDETESRLYTDYYQETVKPDLRRTIEKLIYSQQDYPLYCDHDAVKQLVLEKLNDEDMWKKLLYGYNYFDKWYRIDYKGVKLSDLIFFCGGLIAPDMTSEMLCEKLLSVSSVQRETHKTVDFYNSVLQNYTGKPLMDFLGDLSRSVAGYDDPSDWFADNFTGILKEQAPYGEAQEIKYRIWDVLSGINDARKSIILPILTAPQEDMYLISVPSQLLLGSLNRYNTYLVKDGQERDRMREIIDIYASKMGIFYGVSSTWFDGTAEILNSFVNIHYDTRLNFPQSDAADAGDQDKDKTRDPVMKWVYEANNTISAKNGSAASADGTNVYWMIDAALGTSDYSFFTFSHETAHNQDGRYFYGGAGRRVGTGGEAHADGNIAQEMRDGCMVFNISKLNDIGVEMTNNFSYERINSPEKIKSYYSEMFETGYVLDYLAAKAFLQLDAEQQAAVAVQAKHTPGGNASFSTEYSDISVDEIRKMDLQEISDLWENKISIRNIKKDNSEKVGTATDGSYGFESFYNMNWYQSHNDSGSPDTHSFKRLGMEMLGVGGYEGGYMIYMSASSKNDLDALQQITGDENITWKEYKLRRFKTVEDNLERIGYFDVQTVIQQFRKAFERDAQNGTRSESIAVKRMWYGIVKRATGDFANGGIYTIPEATPVTSAEQLINLVQNNEYGIYELGSDLDFTGTDAPSGSYIQGRFIGMINGNGHSIKGLQYPLFEDLQYAHINNIVLSDMSDLPISQAALAMNAKQAAIGNVVTDNGVSVTLVKNRTDVCYEYGFHQMY